MGQGNYENHHDSNHDALHKSDDRMLIFARVSQVQGVHNGSQGHPSNQKGQKFSYEVVYKIFG